MRGSEVEIIQVSQETHTWTLWKVSVDNGWNYDELNISSCHAACVDVGRTCKLDEVGWYRVTQE